MKAPFRRLLRRPLPAHLAHPEEPSDLVRAVEELQVGQLELARRVSELEQRLAATDPGQVRERQTRRDAK
jgi:hypothetical protein